MSTEPSTTEQSAVPHDALTEKVARIVVALQRAGGDHKGNTASLQQDFLDVVSLVPREIRLPKHNPTANREAMSAEDRLVCLARMRQASDGFYYEAVRCNNHPFVEFTGLMNEYIKLCEEAHAQGIDFTMLSKHTGRHLPFQDYHRAYVREKLECIYGEELLADDRDPPRDADYDRE